MKDWISFEEFYEKHKLGKWKNLDSQKPHFEFSKKELENLYEMECVFSGHDGGLVLGKSHAKGGIHLLQQISENAFKYNGEMEGWEYLTAPETTYLFGHCFEEINHRTKPTSKYLKTNFKIPEDCKIIDTSNANIAFILISPYRQYIINRFATKKHIEEIIELDENTNLKI